MGIEAYAAIALIGGAIAGSQMSKSKTPPLQAATPPPQASKAPDASTMLSGQAGTGQAGGAPGVAQTFLTGPGGIDPSLLQLGKQTLLGG